MSRNYGDTLSFCEENHVDISKALIANEVDFFFADNDKGISGCERADFEKLCDLAAEAYYKVDADTSISTIVDSLKRLIKDGKDINTISRYDIIHNL